MADDLDWIRPYFDAYKENQWEITKWSINHYRQLVVLTAVEVGQALLNLMGQGSTAQIKPLDGLYRTYSKELFDEIIVLDQTQRAMPFADYQDCDNYALTFKTSMADWFNATAVAFVQDDSAGHAYNAIVFSDKTAMLFEPQQDRYPDKGSPITIAAIPTGSGHYSLTSGLILV